MANLQDQLTSSLSGAYTIERELGGGGMSRVFLAEESRLRRKVVVKVLSPELAAGISAERFEREIQLAASLLQANIVPVLSAGESHGLPYYTMPFVEGESLRSRLARDGGVSPAEVQGILRDVARALAYAHERGVVHRDIKPDNVLLSGGAAVVTDFGIAKAIAAARGPAGATLTQFGTSIGTPAYMAPEQAAGDPHVDHRADIYSLGCMAYELVSGQLPFGNRTPQRMLAAHMSEEPRPLLEVAPLASPALATLVMSCLAKDPAARPQSAQDLIRALDAIASGTHHETLHASLLARPGLLKWALGIYIAVFVVVAVVAKAAIVGIGLPEWVLPGAMLVMALGLPVLLFTGYAQSVVRKVALSTPTLTPGGTQHSRTGTMAGIAVKASPHLTWRRTAIGGAFALGLFIAAIGVFMGLRAAGIGPFGSLLAAGRLGDARVLIGDFRATSTDTALGNVVGEAVRADLAQSTALKIVPSSLVAAQLRAMARRPGTKLDTAVAREVAIRAGIPAFVTGSITGLGTGFVVNVRLVGSDSGQTLASFSDVANGPQDLIPTIGKITRKLRDKTGESLKHLQGSPKLADAMTPSLPALRLYTDAQVAFRANDYTKAVRLFEDAIAADSLFAGAYRAAALALGNTGTDEEREMRYARRAFDLSDRLPDVERYQTRAAYYARTDPLKAIDEYEAMHRLQPTSSTPLNNMAITEEQYRRFESAEAHLRLAVAVDTTSPFPGTNLVEALVIQDKMPAADSVLALQRARFPGHALTVQSAATMLLARQDYDSLAKLTEPFIGPDLDPSFVVNAANTLVYAYLVLGRLRDADRLMRVSTAAGRRAENTGADYPIELFMRGSVEAWYRHDRAAALKLIDAGAAESRKLPVGSRPDGMEAFAYAMAGEPVKGRAALAADRRTPGRPVGPGLVQEDETTESLIAYAEKRIAEGIRSARVADTGMCVGCALPFLAMGYDLAGEADSAVAVYTRYVSSRGTLGARGFIDGFMLAGSYKRLGELLEARDPKRALAYYEQMLRLWKNADPELQPQVAEVRKRVDRLRRIGG
jgi:tRNA A-37 threonylcarbamoyl transferase component Bud32/tetratricopeptide (TPR) repeat protein